MYKASRVIKTLEFRDQVDVAAIAITDAKYYKHLRQEISQELDSLMGVERLHSLVNEPDELAENVPSEEASLEEKSMFMMRQLKEFKRARFNG